MVLTRQNGKWVSYCLGVALAVTSCGGVKLPTQTVPGSSSSNPNGGITVLTGLALEISTSVTGTLQSGQCSGPFTITTLNNGTASNVSGTLTVSLSGQGEGSFFSDAFCASPINSTTISSGTHTQTVYFSDPSAKESVLLAASATNYALGSYGVSVAVSNEWIWQSGTQVWTTTSGIPPSSYGTQNVASGSNIPIARCGAISWTDSSNNLWMFGGGVSLIGGGNCIPAYYANDVWSYNLDIQEWTWITGSSSTNAPGVYASNVPGARYQASYAKDSSGNIWMFGGYGIDGSSGTGQLNDLWEWQSATKTWKYITGSQTCNQVGSYSVGGHPGARQGAAMWIDSSNHIWIMGGNGLDASTIAANLDDLWEYSGSSWTYSASFPTQNCNTNLAGTADNTTRPGARSEATYWQDSSGNFFLFGGNGVDSAGGSCSNELNDVWQFNPPSTWTHLPQGYETANSTGVYPSVGQATINSIPSSREGTQSWLDSSNNLWLWGGWGVNNLGTTAYLNDFWERLSSTGEWKLIQGGIAASNQITDYAARMSQASPHNFPGGRTASPTWVDSNGNFWLFGGVGEQATGPTDGIAEDLWQYFF